MNLEFVVATADEEVFREQIMQSKAYGDFVFQKRVGYKNIPLAYNEALTRKGNLVAYVHEDVYLPPFFASYLEEALASVPDDWGVLGAAGVLIDEKGYRLNKGFIYDRGQEWGSKRMIKPAEVQTLDEMLIVTRGDIIFDEQFALHFYAADACMQARARGQKVYAFKSYAHHNSTLKTGERTEEFWKTRALFKEKWKDWLPIITTCTRITEED